MRNFKTIHAKQTVAFNNEDPSTQVVTKEDITITTSYLWGLIKISDVKDITQTYGDSKKGKVGFK